MIKAQLGILTPYSELPTKRAMHGLQAPGLGKSISVFFSRSWGRKTGITRSEMPLGSHVITRSIVIRIQTFLKMGIRFSARGGDI